ELAEDPRFVDMRTRSQNIELVDDLVNAWTRQHSRAKITSRCQHHGVICAPVQTIPETVEDPHMMARGSLSKFQHSGLGEVSLFQTPIRYSEIDPPPIKPVEELGESTDRVLREFLHLSDAEIENLRKSEAI
nr:CoA transferase [Pseudomonadales bacterium]